MRDGSGFPPVSRARAGLLSAVVTCGLLFAGCATLPSDTGPIPASRPGLTDDAALVPLGSLQAEAGIDVRRMGGEDYAASELLLRFGLARQTELRLALGSEGGLGIDAPGQALEDLEVGLKVLLRRGGVGLWEPALTVIPFATLPTGADRLTTDAVEPGMLLVGVWDEILGLEWIGNLGGSAVRGPDGRYLALFAGGAAGRDVTDRLELEVELVRIARLGGHARGPGLWHGALGAGWLVHRDIHLDAWVGLQREGSARGGFVGAGISARR